MPASDPRPAAPSLACRLAAVPPAVTHGPVVARVTLANAGAAPLFVLAWNTPFASGWEGTVFQVTAPGGTSLPYLGPMVKRGDPERGDYLEVPAGGEVTADADLAEVYDFALPGRYQVRIDGMLADVAPDAASLPRPRERHQPVPLACGELMLDVAPAERRP